MSKTKNNMKSSPQEDQFDRCFLTGCDKVTEWQLPWFVENFKKWIPEVKSKYLAVQHNYFWMEKKN